MPTLTTSNSFSHQGDQHTLSLRVTHHLVLGTHDTGLYAVSAKQLQNLDAARWHAGVSLVLRAAEHRANKISAQALQTSSLFCHFRDSLHANLDALGVDEFKERVDGDKLYIDLTINPPSSPRPPQLYLRAIHLDYVWKPTHDSAEAHIFSPNLLLPDVPVLDALFQRFAIYHLVGRHPLIFGPYSHMLDAERKLFPSIARNALTIAVRSPNASMRKSTRKLIARMRTYHERELELISSRLSLLAPTADDLSESAEEDRVTDTRAIIHALERLYRRALRPRRFKAKLPLSGATRGQTTHDDRIGSDLDIDTEDGARMAIDDHTLDLHDDVFAIPEKSVALKRDDIEGNEFAKDMLDFFDAENTDDALDLHDEDEPLDESLLFSDDEGARLSDDEYDNVFTPPPYPRASTVERCLPPHGLHDSTYRASSNAQDYHDTTLDFDMTADDAEWPPTPRETSSSPKPRLARLHSRSPSFISEQPSLSLEDHGDILAHDADLWISDDELEPPNSYSTTPPSKDPSQEEHFLPYVRASSAECPPEYELVNLDDTDVNDCLSFDDD